MAELVYAFDLKSNGEIRTGSSPVSATTILKLSLERKFSKESKYEKRNESEFRFVF